MRRWALVFGPLFAVLVVAGSAAVVAAPPASFSSKTTLDLAVTLATDAVPVPATVATHPLGASTPMGLTFTLNNTHSAAIDQFLAQVEDPAAPGYHHFLTFSEFVQRFSPPESQTQSVESALAAAGGRDISVTPDRSVVSVVLAAGAVEHMLGVRLVEYPSASGGMVYTALGSPSLPPSLAGLVSGVGGLSNQASVEFAAESASATLGPRPAPSTAAEFAYDNSSGEQWYVGSDFTQEYGATELFPGNASVAHATYPRSAAIATLLTSAFNTTFGELPPWDPAVIDKYFNGTLGPGWPIPNVTGVPVTLDGDTPPLPGSYGGWNDSSPYELENSLDLEMAGSLAPGSSLYNFYFGASLINGTSTYGDLADDFAWDLAEALGYSYSPQHLAVVSCSFGLPDLDDVAWDTEMLTAASMGVTVVAASGDQGDAPNSLTGRDDGPWPVWPASDAFALSGALAVGGVSITLSGQPSSYLNGTRLHLTYDPHDGNISSVTTWYDTLGGPGYYGGSEGGVSTVYPEPKWQFASAAEWPIVNATVKQGASTLGRSVPDVAMPANLTLATVSANSTGTIFLNIIQGTSVAAPVLAGILADVDAVLNNGSSGGWNGLGFIDPEVYQFASYFATHPGAPSDPFVDVTSGSNYVFSAGPGWDATTGWGEVEAPALLAAFQNTTLLNYNYTGPTPLLPGLPSSPTGNIPWPVIFAIFGAGIVVAILLVVFAARPSRPRPPPPVVPWGAQGGGAFNDGVPGHPGTPPGATFLCPYCGAIRPSEPVRCPQCGAL